MKPKHFQNNRKTPTENPENEEKKNNKRAYIHTHCVWERNLTFTLIMNVDVELNISRMYDEHVIWNTNKWKAKKKKKKSRKVSDNIERKCREVSGKATYLVRALYYLIHENTKCLFNEIYNIEDLLDESSKMRCIYFAYIFLLQ